LCHRISQGPGVSSSPSAVRPGVIPITTPEQTQSAPLSRPAPAVREKASQHPSSFIFKTRKRVACVLDCFVRFQLAIDHPSGDLLRIEVHENECAVGRISFSDAKREFTILEFQRGFVWIEYIEEYRPRHKEILTIHRNLHFRNDGDFLCAWNKFGGKQNMRGVNARRPNCNFHLRPVQSCSDSIRPRRRYRGSLLSFNRVHDKEAS